MIQGLAIWHYPHRTMVENIRFFAAQGFPSVSVHGAQFVAAIADPDTAQGIADAVEETGVVFTVHYALPKKHQPDAVAAFRAGISAIADWQRHTEPFPCCPSTFPRPSVSEKASADTWTLC